MRKYATPAYYRVAKAREARLSGACLQDQIKKIKFLYTAKKSFGEQKQSGYISFFYSFIISIARG